MEKLIITAAICGAEVLKEHNPAVPYTVEECAREAKSAYDAGASIIYEGENETYIEASVENSSSILYDKEIRNKPRTRRTKRNV